MKKMTKKSKVNVRKVGIEYYIEVSDALSDHCLPVTREELIRIIDYAKVVLKEK